MPPTAHVARAARFLPGCIDLSRGDQSLAKSIIRAPRKRLPRRDSSTRFTSPAFRPYALLIGQVALAWNDLQESLGELFAGIMLGADDQQATAVWQSAKADRAKRDMLKAAVKEMSLVTVKRHPKLEEEIDWISGRLQTLEDLRNNAVHSPLISRDSPLWAALGPMPLGVQPNNSGGNTRALQLEGKDLLREFRYCRDFALVLGDYVAAITNALWSMRKPWPDRPPLPNRGDRNRQSHPRKAEPPDSVQGELALPLRRS